jgi:gluconokinase
MVVVLMGVSGSGKTTIGRLLAHDLGWPFYDADDFHPPANVEKMRRGIALTDADRDPWLAALRELIAGYLRDGHSAIVACSALKRSYRDRLRVDKDRVRLVYLKGDFALLRQRLEARQSHFAKANLLASQFETLEEPQDALTVEVGDRPEAVVGLIRRGLRL